MKLISPFYRSIFLLTSYFFLYCLSTQACLATPFHDEITAAIKKLNLICIPIPFPKDIQTIVPSEDSSYALAIAQSLCSVNVKKETFNKDYLTQALNTFYQKQAAMKENNTASSSNNNPHIIQSRETLSSQYLSTNQTPSLDNKFNEYRYISSGLIDNSFSIIVVKVDSNKYIVTSPNGMLCNKQKPKQQQKKITRIKLSKEQVENFLTKIWESLEIDDSATLCTPHNHGYSLSRVLDTLDYKMEDRDAESSIQEPKSSHVEYNTKDYKLEPLHGSSSDAEDTKRESLHGVCSGRSGETQKPALSFSTEQSRLENNEYDEKPSIESPQGNTPAPLTENTFSPARASESNSDSKDNLPTYSHDVGDETALCPHSIKSTATSSCDLLTDTLDYQGNHFGRPSSDSNSQFDQSSSAEESENKALVADSATSSHTSAQTNKIEASAFDNSGNEEWDDSERPQRKWSRANVCRSWFLPSAAAAAAAAGLAYACNYM